MVGKSHFFNPNLKSYSNLISCLKFNISAKFLHEIGVLLQIIKFHIFYANGIFLRVNIIKLILFYCNIGVTIDKRGKLTSNSKSIPTHMPL